MRRKEERLEVFRKSDFAGCGELLRKALKYAIDEWTAMKRVLVCVATWNCLTTSASR